MDRRGRPAFTLVELLVVIAITGLLLALTLSATQRVRATAQRAGCQNNLRQIALALHQYHGAKGTLPSGCRNRSDPQRFMSWLTRILPYLEMEAVWQEAERAYATTRNILQPPHRQVSAHSIPVFICPADGRLVVDFPSGPEGLTAFMGVLGRDSYWNDGVLYLDSATRFGDITDGTSTTLMVGERPASDEGVYGRWYTGYGKGYDGAADFTLGVREGIVVYEECDRTMLTNHFTPPLGTICDAFHYWSRHTGGGSFAFCDGSVRFLAYSADPLLPALATRAGGEPAPQLD